MLQRHEFVMLFEQDGANRHQLCRRFGISPTIGYRLLGRFRREGEAGRADRSRRPQRSPARTPAEMEELVLAIRDEHPACGGRKISRRLQDLGRQAGAEPQHDYCGIAPQHRAFERFERAAPNDLWQMGMGSIAPRHT